jgi:hypothetical protein
VRKLQIGILGDRDDLALIDSAASLIARRGAILLVPNNPFGALVVQAGGKVPSMRYFSFGYPKDGGELEIRVKFPTEIMATELLCASADGIILLGENSLAEAICRKLAKPVIKPKKAEDCLEAVSDLLNKVLSDIIKQ